MKFLYSLIFCALMFSSCKKDDSFNDITSLEATIDGEFVKMDQLFKATLAIDTLNLSTSSFEYSIELRGSDSGENTNSMGLFLNSKRPLISGEYGQTGECPVPSECTVFSYSIPFPFGLQSSSSEAGFKLNLTTIEFKSGGKVSGTFSGTAYSIKRGEISTVENGKFNFTFE